MATHEKKNCHSEFTVSSPWVHGELTVTTVVTALGPMITAQSRLGEVTARSQLNHGPGHGSVTAGCDHFAHGELTVSSHGGQFFSHGQPFLQASICSGEFIIYHSGVRV